MTSAALSNDSRPGLFTPHWANWRLALLASLVVIPLAIVALPQGGAFWVSFIAAGLVALTS
ncbi:MAG: hypothetical protein ACRC14_04020, partial [Paracoccaceae bacterium]